MGEPTPLSSSSPGSAASYGEMVRVVVKRLGNGVDCLRRVEKVTRAVMFPPGARLLDMDDARVRDLVMLGFERAGVDLPTDAVVMGCAYEVGDETHKCAWVSEEASVPVVSRVADWLRHNAMPRRALVAALLMAAYMAPSPFEWGEVIASAAPLMRICWTAVAATVPRACVIAGPLCGGDEHGQ